MQLDDLAAEFPIELQSAGSEAPRVDGLHLISILFIYMYQGSCCLL